MEQPIIRVLVIDDEYELHARLRADLRDFLELYRAEPEFKITANITEAFKLFSHNKIHLVVINPALFHLTDDLIADLRHARSMPILIFSQEYTSERRIHYLDLGADTVLPVPVVYDEYRLSVKALLRRYYITAKQLDDVELRSRYLHLEVDPRWRTVKFKEKTHPVTRKEFEVLRLLMDHPGQILYKDHIYRKVWKTDIGDSEKSVTDIIYRIRKKLGSEFDDDYIENIHSTGYRFGRGIREKEK